jgi:mutual gliding-motility protein MglA
VGSHKEGTTVVVVSYSGKEINAKLVYYGAGLSGKTTNLESIYEAVPDTSRGKMVSMKTQSDRTLFFDLLPLDLGEIMGFKTRFLLYTVPGQVFYNATRKLVLKGADAIVFVADSEVGKMEENKESLANLRANLAEYNLSLDALPWVIQYNKRDLPNLYTVEELNAELNPGGKVPFFEAVATQGKGVFETFRGISHLLMEKVTRDLRRSSSTTTRPAPHEEPKPVAPAPRAEAVFQPAALPTSPGRAIQREAQQTPAPVVAEGVGTTLDYGREIELPDTFPPSPAGDPQPVAQQPLAAAGVHAPAPISAPVPVATPALASRAPVPQPRGVVSQPVAPAPEPPAPAAAEPVSVVEALAARVAGRGVTVTPAPAPAPAPVETPAPAPVATAPAAATVADEKPRPVVIPIRLPRDTSCEIVLRIVIGDDEKAA